ncbi:hypothetical protein BG015_005778 [Linnemannia schmuckeri]|uniref:Uncharacterized protein n=1 Tax=Linnemannia schmuckeri TaxID=64567 RepID=A0A9P5R3Z0_9FUNG|nr:hypothetical protein BG015_005778 [Linnemannia schmuckeri]
MDLPVKAPMGKAAIVMMTFARDHLPLATQVIFHMEVLQAQEQLQDPMQEKSHPPIPMDLTQWMKVFPDQHRWITALMAIRHLVMVDLLHHRVFLEEAIRQPRLQLSLHQQMVPRCLRRDELAMLMDRRTIRIEQEPLKAERMHRAMLQHIRVPVGRTPHQSEYGALLPSYGLRGTHAHAAAIVAASYYHGHAPPGYPGGAYSGHFSGQGSSHGHASQQGHGSKQDDKAGLGQSAGSQSAGSGSAALDSQANSLTVQTVPEHQKVSAA